MKKYVVILGSFLGVVFSILCIVNSNREKDERVENSNIYINSVTDFQEKAEDLDVLSVRHPCDCIYEKHAGYILPEDISLAQDYGLYIKDLDGKYTIFHDMVYEFLSHDRKRQVTITYSDIEEPFKDYEYLIVEPKISFILEKEVIIGKMDEYYFASLELAGRYYNIETTNLSEEELIALILGIIEERDHDIHVNSITWLEKNSLDDVQIASVTNSTICITSDPYYFEELGFSFDDAFLVYRDNSNHYSDLHFYYEKGEEKLLVAYVRDQEPVQNYNFKSEDVLSYINGIGITISKYDQQYFVTFSYKNYNYYIETENIREEQLVQVLEKILL